jgi:hypothetical protein
MRNKKIPTTKAVMSNTYKMNNSKMTACMKRRGETN